MYVVLSKLISFLKEKLVKSQFPKQFPETNSARVYPPSKNFKIPIHSVYYTPSYAPRKKNRTTRHPPPQKIWELTYEKYLFQCERKLPYHIYFYKSSILGDQHRFMKLLWEL